jgi:hypothetical protein
VINENTNGDKLNLQNPNLDVKPTTIKMESVIFIKDVKDVSDHLINSELTKVIVKDTILDIEMDECDISIEEHIN